MQFKLNNTKLHLFLWLPLFLTLSGCAGFGSAAYSSGTTAGTVFDADTNQPIADAIVVTSWEGTRSFLQSYTNCYHVETARTDANGNYKMAAWALPPLNEFPLITNKTDYTKAFKTGYIDVSYPDNIKGAWGKGAKIYLVKFTGTNEEYFEYLKRVDSNIKNCGENAAKNTYKLNSTVLNEMKKIAQTPEHQKTIAARSYWLVYDKVNPNKPTKDDEHANTVNIDPKDNYTEEELLK